MTYSLSKYSMQEDFNSDIAWLVATGIEGKMKRELQKILPSYWTMPTDYELVPLSLVHLMLSFLICLGGLGIASIVFVTETVHDKFQIRKLKPFHPITVSEEKKRGGKRDRIGKGFIRRQSTAMPTVS